MVVYALDSIFSGLGREDGKAGTVLANNRYMVIYSRVLVLKFLSSPIAIHVQKAQDLFIFLYRGFNSDYALVYLLELLDFLPLLLLLL